MKAQLPAAAVATVCVVLTALAQIALKSGLSSPRITTALHEQQWGALLGHAGTNAPLLLGILLYALGTVLWFYLLTYAELSYVYPFLGIGFILTTFLAAVYLGEPVTVSRWAGVLLIAMGVLFVARS